MKTIYIFSRRFGDFIPISSPLLVEFNETVYRYFVPRHNIIKPEQNDVSNGCQTFTAFHLNLAAYLTFNGQVNLIRATRA